MAIIDRNGLSSFAADLLEAGGFTRGDSDQMADLLVWANLRGVESHGVLRIPRYIEMLKTGIVSTGQDVKVVRRTGAISVLDASKAPGAVGMNRAVRESLELSDQFGIGWAAVRRTSHCGAIGYFVDQVAARGKIGIAMTASKPLMSYYGAKGEALSTNPLAIAAPTPGGAAPIILDMSTASVPLGKILAAKDEKTKIPLGWGIDADGAETDDPNKVAAVLPLAGPKGSGLSLMIEILCSVLVGSANIAPALSGGEPGGFTGLVLTVDPAAFGDSNSTIDDIGKLSDAIHSLEPAPGFERVLLPGERGAETQRERELEGIPVVAGTIARLKEVAEQTGVKIPESFN